jgi:hypothetical protein
MTSDDLATAATHDPFDEMWSDLSATLETSVLGVVRAAAEQHREAMASQGLEADAPTEWKARAERLLEYRRSVAAGLLGPLDEVYSRRGPSTLIAEALEAAFASGVSRCKALPETAADTWPEGALAARPSDRFGRKVGKVFARVLSGARRAGGERKLPLRAVVTRHFDRVAVPQQRQLAASALQAWGEWSHRLEWACVRWGASAMPGLIRAERPEEDDGTEVWKALREAAQGLQAALDALLEDNPLAASDAAAKATLASSQEVLEADLAVAGSFLLRPDPADPEATLGDLGKRAEALREWDEAVGARIRMYASLLGILSGATAVRRRTVWRFRDHCLSSVTELSEIAESLEALRAELVQPGEFGLQKRIGEIDTAVDAALDGAARAIPTKHAVDAALRDLSDTTIEALFEMIRDAPDSLDVHDVEATPPQRGRKVERRPLLLQDLARQSFDALRIERIRSSTSGLVDAISAIRADTTELKGVYSFARDEAMRELEEAEEGAGDRADDLVGGALRNIAEALRAEVTRLDGAVDTAQRRLAAEIADGSMALVGRVEAGRMGARLFAARSRVTKLWTWAMDRWGPPVQHAWRRLALLVARLRRLGTRALRKGSAIVGSAPPAASSTRTLRALGNTGALIEGLPLVYQRLFTLAPLTDGALLAGRDADLEDAMRRWKQWHDDEGVPLIVRSRQGSGITSFLNVFGLHIEQDGGRISRATLDERISCEADLAAYLATLLGLESTESLSQLSSQIFDARPDALPGAVSIDNLEHLFLRVPKGTDLIERLLTLMAETEPRVFWIAGVRAAAWKLIGMAEPTAVSQVDVFDLLPLSPSGLRSAITARHRRSGLAITYEEPTGAIHDLRRRFRRGRQREVVHEQLEEAYFERLHRTSGGHLGLALVQWLGSADFTAGDGVLMRQPERLDFSVLDALDLTQNFTLKAFLEHRSLTLDEHDRVFRVAREESYQIIESLRNRHLLEPVTGGEGEADARSEIEEEALRYRVRPLLVGAVTSHLQARNIVH